MKLKQLLKGIAYKEVKGSREIEVSGISSDSRTVVPGHLFIAKKGLTTDGAQFIPQALRAGAVAIVTDIYDPFAPAVQIIAPDPAAIEAALAARFYGDPSRALFTVGVTGTKGKTTTTYRIQHLLEGLNQPTGLIGTVETVIREQRFFSQFTTHDAIANQKLLKEMLLRGCKAAVLEVSSHGLAQGRVDEIAFDRAVFTNLHADHLDYHQSVERYAAAKRTLFERARGMAIFNADSPWSRFMQEGSARLESLTYAIAATGDLTAHDIAFDAQGTRLALRFRGQKTLLHTPLIGRFNVYNLLAAAALGLSCGAALEEVGEILARFERVPGRLEAIPNERGFGVFVDYAHTGEALDNVLQTLRELSSGRLLVVFGCGGNRDPNRRPEMAQAAEKHADQAILTTDNPRGEDPSEICRQILKGFAHPERAIVELDRKKAIERAVHSARAGDIVLIAGKGHERGQIFAHQTFPFDDVAIAKSALLGVSSHSDREEKECP